MSRYVLTIPAKQDLKEINRYIIRYNPDAARRLNEKIKQQCKLLADFPNMGQSSDTFVSGLRSFPVEDYLIFYRPIDGGVEVVRIVSGYRDLETVF
ncbi:type II toxin-antitoxin system RelE/ParE family toxin [Nostoc sp. C052]|uniref:type II toxin-antitoxin system RelE/ParE family toxin n=1 Tax=Nostoc sp. C052 TaxID=2576902 RepID=UPI0015C35D26|nr:type II toxin-antitoxin system RelE/ParE family toxin [Nostoc sp. C052]QLE40316.1 type II toxin-antitoxin system RelE/ParE family toxin [Nostoc sp. C052]